MGSRLNVESPPLWLRPGRNEEYTRVRLDWSFRAQEKMCLRPGAGNFSSRDVGEIPASRFRPADPRAHFWEGGGNRATQTKPHTDTRATASPLEVHSATEFPAESQRGEKKSPVTDPFASVHGSITYITHNAAQQPADRDAFTSFALVSV